MSSPRIHPAHEGASPIAGELLDAVRRRLEVFAGILRCRAKDPDERPQSVRELARALRATGLAEGWTEEDAALGHRDHVEVRARAEARELEGVAPTQVLIETDVTIPATEAL